MKVKRATKISVLAIAVVAMFGIATVSFAAWNGGSKELTANAATGYVDLIGFKSNANIAFDNDLVPLDQTGTISTGCATMAEANLPAYEVTKNYTITVTSDTTLKVYAYVGTTAPTAPTQESDLTTESGWKQVKATNDAVFNFNAPTANQHNEIAANTTKVWLVLVSSVNSEANTDFTLKVELAQ